MFNQPKDLTMKAAIFGILVAAFASPALASGNHAGGHGEAMAVGEPGKKANATQTIRVTMKETDDGKMIFTPSTFKVRKGQTVVFAIKNDGELDHEFVLDQEDKIIEHKAAMEKFPEMEHDDPNAIRLEPGKSGEIIWKFTNDGTFKIACLVPGHYDAGMHGDVTVAKK
ncbi:copper oxidase [Sinorhizobium sp. GL2]|nr:copper oxidase [Sinorhizobium sp. GL2]